MITLSQEGSKSYKTKFDLIHLRESNHSNELWQADHTLLDIEVLDEKNQHTRPWLTIIMDDYSRAIAGYHLTFEAPSAINTALTLHQAIWKKKMLTGQFVEYLKNFIPIMEVTLRLII